MSLRQLYELIKINMNLENENFEVVALDEDDEPYSIDEMEIDKEDKLITLTA